MAIDITDMLHAATTEGWVAESQQVKYVDGSNSAHTVSSIIDSVVEMKDLPQPQVVPGTDLVQSDIATSAATDMNGHSLIQTRDMVETISGNTSFYNLDKEAPLGEGKHYAFSGSKETYVIKFVSGITTFNNVSLTIGEGTKTAYADSAMTETQLANFVFKNLMPSSTGSYRSSHTNNTDTITVWYNSNETHPFTVSFDGNGSGGEATVTQTVHGGASALTAINTVVPNTSEYRMPGIHMAFTDPEGNLESWQYLGGTFNVASSWGKDGAYFTTLLLSEQCSFTSGQKVSEIGIDEVPTAGSDNLVKSGGVQNELALGAVYDVSAHNNGATFASLEALLSDANLNTLIPTSVRRGGMSIKFIQTSDNNSTKYVQYRLMADSWSADTDDWAFCGDDVLVENPEFLKVYTDENHRIVLAIKVDGTIYYGAGVPPQIIAYIQAKIDELSLDEYEDIVTFLDGLEEGDTTLRTMLTNLNTVIGNEVTRATTAEGTKVDKVTGKSLIDAGYAESMSSVENPEWMDVKTDNEDKILEAIRVDGRKIINKGIDVKGGAKIKGEIILEGINFQSINSPEFLGVWLDSENRIIAGIRSDGDICFGVGVPSQIKNYINSLVEELQTTKQDKEAGKGLSSNDYTDKDKEITNTFDLEENPEYISVETDANGHILSGRVKDGTKFEIMPIKTPGVTIDHTEEHEGRSEIKTDSEGKIISYRDKDGVLHESRGIKTKSLVLSDEGVGSLGKALKEGGYANLMDWSDEEFVEIPIPEVCAIVNIGTDSQANAKGLDIPTYIQYWDKSGNYFKKPILLNAQGSSSMSYHIKNQAIELDDGSEIKFGTWPAFDSFHIKKYFIDVFRGQCIVGYWLTEQIYQTRPYGERKPWNYIDYFNDVDGANGSFAKDFDNGAMAHPDGFPVHVFFNGKDAGIYAFNIKKARGNYNMKKDKQKQIILDGYLGTTFFNCNGDLSQSGQEAGHATIWEDFEIRNPKISKDINGDKYDGDNPKEPSDDYTTTKNAIKRLTTALTAIRAESTDADKKSKFEEFFNVPFFIDYDLISQVIYHHDGYAKNWIWCCWDGDLWTPTSYDMDSIFGMSWDGKNYVSASVDGILGDSIYLPTYYFKENSLFWTEVCARYKELRDCGVFSVDNIVGLLEKWVNKCGYDNLKNDIENIATSPYIENGEKAIIADFLPVMIPNTPSYRDGTKTYAYAPGTGGWYNSILRVKNWLTARLEVLDVYYGYINS